MKPTVSSGSLGWTGIPRVIDLAVLATLVGPRILLMEPAFSDDFPWDCPPKGAAECGGAVFRFVEGDPPASGEHVMAAVEFEKRYTS
jgi:hypothetical protein